MAIDWGLVGSIASAAFTAYNHFFSEPEKEAEQRKRMEEAIRRAVNKIVEQMNLMEIGLLKGELEGFADIYASYDPDPSDPLEEGRLVSLIDDSSRVLGRLGAHIDKVGSDSPATKLAFESWTIYLPLLYLRAQAMAERQRTYGAEETTDALPSFDMALDRGAALLSYLRRVSDHQFGPVVCKPIPDVQNTRVCWYWMRNTQFVCGSTRDPRGVEKCKQSRAKLMDSAYLAFEGVREIRAAVDQLQDAREMIDTINALDILKDKGVDVGEVIMVRGRFTRSRPPPDAAGSAGDAARSADWFS